MYEGLISYIKVFLTHCATVPLLLFEIIPERPNIKIRAILILFDEGNKGKISRCPCFLNPLHHRTKTILKMLPQH